VGIIVVFFLFLPPPLFLNSSRARFRVAPFFLRAHFQGTGNDLFFPLFVIPGITASSFQEPLPLVADECAAVLFSHRESMDLFFPPEYFPLSFLSFSTSRKPFPLKSLPYRVVRIVSDSRSSFSSSRSGSIRKELPLFSLFLLMIPPPFLLLRKRPVFPSFSFSRSERKSLIASFLLFILLPPSALPSREFPHGAVSSGQADVFRYRRFPPFFFSLPRERLPLDDLSFFFSFRRVQNRGLPPFPPPVRGTSGKRATSFLSSSSPPLHQGGTQNGLPMKPEEDLPARF